MFVFCTALNFCILSLVHSSPDSPIYYIGDPFNISCSLVDTEMSSDLTIKWTVPEKSSIKDTLPAPPATVLSIPQATEKDKGRWKCHLMKKTMTLVSAELNLKIGKQRGEHRKGTGYLGAEGWELRGYWESGGPEAGGTAGGGPWGRTVI